MFVLLYIGVSMGWVKANPNLLHLEETGAGLPKGEIWNNPVFWVNPGWAGATGCQQLNVGVHGK